MVRDPLIEVHEAADRAQSKLESVSYRVGRRLVIIQRESAKQLNRFRYPVAIFVMAVILIMILISKDIQHNLKVVVGFLVALNFVEDDQVPESTEAIEVEGEWADDS